MAFEVTINIPALDRFVDFAIAQGAPVVSTKPAKTPPIKAGTTKVEEPAVEVEQVAEEQIDYSAQRAEATKLLQKVNAANGVAAVVAALGEFGVKNISALPDEKLGEAIASFETKLT